MRVLGLLLLACGLAAADETPEERLAEARRDLKVARGEFKRLARVERTVLAEARTAVFSGTKRGASLAPALGAAADQLRAAAKAAAGEPVAARLAAMAESYEAMTRELDAGEGGLPAELREAAPADRAARTLARARTLLAEAEREEATDDAATAWSLLEKGDPRLASLARNAAALDAAYAALARAEPEGRVSVHLANAKELHAAAKPCFDGVETKRPPPPEALPAP